MKPALSRRRNASQGSYAKPPMVDLRLATSLLIGKERICWTAMHRTIVGGSSRYALVAAKWSLVATAAPSGDVTTCSLTAGYHFDLVGPQGISRNPKQGVRSGQFQLLRIRRISRSHHFFSSSLTREMRSTRLRNPIGSYPGLGPHSGCRRLMHVHTSPSSFQMLI